MASSNALVHIVSYVEENSRLRPSMIDTKSKYRSFVHESLTSSAMLDNMPRIVPHQRTPPFAGQIGHIDIIKSLQSATFKAEGCMRCSVRPTALRDKCSTGRRHVRSRSYQSSMPTCGFQPFRAGLSIFVRFNVLMLWFSLVLASAP